MYDSYYQYFFIHNTFGHFYYDTLNYFGTYLYPRFEHKIVATFDKAVEYITKKEGLNGREEDKPNLPALVLNPTGDFGLAEANAGGRQLWRFPNLSPELNFKMFSPIYQDANVLISPAFVRVKGEFDLYMLLNSFYEYCDLRMFLLQMFGGLERYIYPLYFNSFFVLPDEILNLSYHNDVTGETYQIDWDSNSSEVLVKTINKYKRVIPLQIKPIYRLINMNDNSNKPGGTDKLSEWRLNATIEFECEMPWFLVMKTDYLVENLDMNIDFDSAYSSRNYSVNNNVEQESSHSENIETQTYHHDLDIDANVNNPMVPPKPTLEETDEDDYNPLMTEYQEFLDSDDGIRINIKIKDKSLVLRERYFYYYTEADHNEQDRIEITIEDKIFPEDLILLYADDIKLAYGEHYVVNVSTNILTLFVQNLPYRIYEDDLLDILLYSPQGG